MLRFKEFLRIDCNLDYTNIYGFYQFLNFGGYGLMIFEKLYCTKKVSPIFNAIRLFFKYFLCLYCNVFLNLLYCNCILFKTDQTFTVISKFKYHKTSKIQ